MRARVFSAVACLLAVAGLVQGATIRGVVSNSRTSEPIVGAVVILAATGQAADTATTGRDGGYSFADVATGNYMLAATAAGYQPGMANARIDRNNQNLTRDIVLTPIAVLGQGTVVGAVTDSASSEPLEGATVVLSLRSGFGGGAVYEPMDTATTDVEGKYAFNGLAVDGRYAVSATLNGYLAAMNNNVRVVSQDTTVVDLAMVEVGSRLGAVAGTITAADGGEPVAGALVILGRRTSFISPFVPVDSATTLADGKYSFADVVAQSGYAIVVSAQGFETRTRGNITVTIGETTTVDLSLVATVPPSSVVMGTVVNSVDSAGIVGATVVLRRGARDATGAIVWTAVDTATTTSGGSFAFAGIAATTNAEPYGLVASAVDYNTRTLNNIQVAESDTTRVSLALVKIVKGNIHVFVANEADDSPIAGATVVAALEQSTGEMYKGTTSALGWVDFAGVIAGNYTLTVSKSGYVTETQARRVTEGEEDSSTVLLAQATAGAGRTLLGTIANGDGEPVSGADVVLTAGSANEILTLTATSAADGGYEIAGIPEAYGRATVTVTADGFEVFTGTVNLGNDTVTLDVELVGSTGAVRYALGGLGVFRVSPRFGGSVLAFDNVRKGSQADVYTFDGRRIISRLLPEGSVSVRLPGDMGSQHVILTVTQQGRIVWRGVVSH